MLNAIPMVISKESFEQIFTFAEDNSALAKNLYNAALFSNPSGLYGME